MTSVARWVDGHQSRWVLWVGAVGSVIGPMRWIPTILPQSSTYRVWGEDEARTHRHGQHQ
jgi:hypothetical protein